MGLARLFLQPTTRDGQPPSPMQSYTMVQLDEGGPLLAGELAAGGQPQVFAQVVFERTANGAVSERLAGPDRSAIVALLDALRDQLQDELVLIEKRASDVFTITPLKWQDSRYQPGEVAQVPKPPVSGIWFEPLRKSSSMESSESWTVFHRSTGQLVGRSPDLNHLRAMLTLLRVDLDVLAAALDQPGSDGATPAAGVNLQVKADLHAMDRTCVKIGLNLTAHLFGIDVVRRADFDSAVAYAIGEGVALRRAQLPSALLGPAMADRHVFYLRVDRSPDDKPVLLFMARLYESGPIESFVLAELVAPISQLQSTVVHVDYTANRFERMSLDEHLLRAFLGAGTAVS